MMKNLKKKTILTQMRLGISHQPDNREDVNPTIHEEEEQQEQLAPSNNQEDKNVVCKGDDEES